MFLLPKAFLSRGANNYRKRLGIYSYKIRKREYFKNPHAVRLQHRNTLKSIGHKGELRIRELERNSPRPFGQFTRKGRFHLHIDKVPFYNIPDLTGFTLKPYVAPQTPRIPEESAVPRKISFGIKELYDMDKKIERMPKPTAPSKMDPLSRMPGRRVG